MRTNKTNWFRLLLCGALLLGLLSTAALAAGPATDLSSDLQSGNVTITAPGTYSIANVTTANHITVASGVECSLTISGLTITATDAPALYIESGATLNLTVTGENSLTGGAGFAGIGVEPEYILPDYTLDTAASAKLNITGSGALTAQGGAGTGSTSGGGAGIGGNGQHQPETDGRNDVDFGVITVQETFTGTINATGGAAVGNDFGGGAGIGSGGFNADDFFWGTVVGEVYLNGGTVNGNPGGTNLAVGAGIGGGSGQGDDTVESEIVINISGGTVNAQGGILGAGVGGGGLCDGGRVTISGGTVNALAGAPDNSLGAAGIGGGNDASVRLVNITGGTVTATASGGGAGIGGGSDTQYSSIHYGDTNGTVSEGKKGVITISGPGTQVTARGGTGIGSNGTYGGAGIGAGYVSVATNRSVAMDISVGYGAQLTAYSGYHAQAIGYGYHPRSQAGGVAYTGYGITLELDDSITLWAVNDDYYRPALVQANEYAGGPVIYGDVKYLSEDIYLVTYTDENPDRTGNITSGTARGSLEADEGGLNDDADVNWTFDGGAQQMTLDVEGVVTTDEPLNTPFSELHGNWATLYPAPIYVRYEWVGPIRPGDVEPPATEFLVKGTEYTAQPQDPTGEGYVFDGWYLDAEATMPFTSGTLYQNTTLYGQWRAAGGLTVAKSVTGSDGETDRDFHFTVTLGDTNISGTYGGMTFTNGIADFTLRDGESIAATGLFADIDYTVTEQEANTDGYTTTATNAEGTIPANETAMAEFTNNREAAVPSPAPTPTPAPPSSIPQTGDSGGTLWWLLLTASVLGLTVCRLAFYKT